MEDVMIYHPMSGRYLCVDTPELQYHDDAIVEMGFPSGENITPFIWCYSNREGTCYESFSAQGLHHKKTGAILGIAGTGEEVSNAVVIYSRATCRDLLLTVKEQNEKDRCIIWSRAGLFLTCNMEENTLTWSNTCLPGLSEFQFIA